jgi:hypothetical protein
MKYSAIAGAILAVYYSSVNLLIHYLQIAGIAEALCRYLHESITGLLIYLFCRYSRYR